MITKKLINKIKSEEYQTRFETGKSLYTGRQHEVFQTNRVTAKVNEEKQYLGYNIFAQITDTFSNLMFYEKPKFNFSNPTTQEWFDNYANETGFFDKLQEIAQITSFAGDCVFSLNLDENEQPEIVILPNTRWIPIYNEDRPDKETAIHMIEYEYKKDNEEILVYQVFDNKTNTISLLAFKGDEQVTPPEEFLTGYTEIDGLYTLQLEHLPFYRIPNRKIVGEYFGLSDYTISIINKSEEINHQIELISYVLTKTADPILLVPKKLIQSTIHQINQSDIFAKSLGLNDQKADGLFANLPATNLSGFQGLTLQETIVAEAIVRKSKILPVSVEDGKPEYVSHDPHVDKMKDFIEFLTDLIYREAKLSPALFDKNFSTGDLSGVALQRLIQETLHKVHQKTILFESVLKDLIFNILILAGLTPEVPTIEWYDGIIDNRIEKIDEAERLLTNEMITKKEAIKMVMGYTDKQAEASIIEIEKETGENKRDEPLDNNSSEI